MARTPKLPTEERLTRAAMFYLDRYSSSAANLRKVLARKVHKAALAFDRNPDEFSAMIDAVVVKCQRAGIVDDRSYAETKMAGMRRRGRSRRQIEAQLQAKGVSRDVIESVVANDTSSDQDAADAYARRRRFGPWRQPDDRPKFRDKDMAALCRAGFSFDVARKAIDREPDEADGADGWQRQD